MSRDIPIIFSGPMVRAIMEGRKTQTRRVVDNVPPPPAMDAVSPRNPVRHDAPYFDAYCSERKSDDNPRGMSRNWCWWTRDDRQCLPTVNVKYAPGDRLWVREAVARIDNSEFGQPSYWQYRADTDGECFPGDWPPETKDDPDRPRWCPAIHMPRTASRVTLVCDGVKVERLQSISRDDAIAEGATARPNCSGFQRQSEGWSMDWSRVGKFSKYATGGPGPLQECDISLPDPQSAFAAYINRLHGGPRWNCNGKTPLWDQNPFVVAPTFRVIKANIDAPEARAAA